MALKRLRHAWAIMTGKIILPAQLEEMQLMTALTQTATAIEALTAAANALIAENQKNASDLATANQTIAQADSETATSINAVTATLTAAVPPAA